MKKSALLLIALSVAGIINVSAQQNSVEPGTVLVIMKPEGDFQHIKVPRSNFIIKQSGVANLNSLDRNLIVVTSVYEKNGQTLITLNRKNGEKFFRNYKSLSAKWPSALESGELRKVE